jgi:hypothetical protein
MPAIDPTFTPVSGVVQTQWVAASTANTPNALLVKNNAARKASIQITGTFGGATVALQGSNDGVNYVTLKDVTNTAISTTSATLVDFETSVLYLKPLITGGTGDSITITVVMRGI